MKTLKTVVLVLAVFLTLYSCSKDEIEDENSKCGVVISKSENVISCSDGPNTGYAIGLRYSDGTAEGLCVDESTYNSLEIGSNYCYSSITIN